MTPEELKFVYTLACGMGLGTVVAAVVGFFFLKFTGAYSSRKGENLATKEDIAEITGLQKEAEHKYNVLLEEVRNTNSSQLEDRRHRNALRTAALEERLNAHQEAFTLWRKLLFVGDREPKGEVIMECQDFFDKRCLYLEPEVREAFSKAYHFENLRQNLVQMRAPGDQIVQAWEHVRVCGDIILNAVKLPPLAATDTVPLEDSVEVMVRELNEAVDSHEKSQAKLPPPAK